MIQVFGLANCDSTKAALKWLKQHNIESRLHDFKQEGVTATELGGWLTQIPLVQLLNRKSTTWRGLTAAEQAAAAQQKSAIRLMVKYPNLIKRPVVAWPGDRFTTGFNEKVFASLIKDDQE